MRLAPSTAARSPSPTAFAAGAETHHYPRAWVVKPSKIPGPRLVALDRTLLGLAMKLERDEVTRLTSNLVHAPLNHAFACVDGGVLIGAGGLAPVWFGRAEAWMLVSALARPRQIVAGVRLARRWLDARCRQPEFRRLEIFVRAGVPWRLAFVQALGFDAEGHLLRCWGPDGADHVLHERISLRSSSEAVAHKETL